MAFDKFLEGEIFIFPNGTIARIIKRCYPRLKLRCVRGCSGKYSHRDRIGRPYTYQRWTKIKHMKNAIRIGTEEILEAVFEHQKHKEFRKNHIRLLTGKNG